MRPILTSAAMLAAEQRAIDAGTSVETLMERAGAALAEAAFRFAGKMPALVLAGPGNNGGDGYVAARHLASRGVPVRVAALAEPRSAAAQWARSQWAGAVEALGDSTASAPLLIDALFGTGLKRGLEEVVIERVWNLVCDARCFVACDLPSGVSTDDGAILSPVWNYQLTVTFGALKPAHRLMPAMTHMGRVVLADIGIDAGTDWSEIGPPELMPTLQAQGHKYDRGMVAILSGEMPGAAALSATAAARTGAGYVRLHAENFAANVPASVVQGQGGSLSDKRIGAVLAGPGLGRAEDRLQQALSSGRPLILDADALTMLGDPARLRGLDCVITPHEGEFRRLFPDVAGSKAARALEAARRSGAVVVYKGPDTLVASPHGFLGFAPPAPAWLATAGTGDVLAGMIASLRARGLGSWDSACAAVWLHGRAAESAGPHMIADDLAAAIPQALQLVDG